MAVIWSIHVAVAVREANRAIIRAQTRPAVRRSRQCMVLDAVMAALMADGRLAPETRTCARARNDDDDVGGRRVMHEERAFGERPVAKTQTRYDPAPSRK